MQFLRNCTLLHRIQIPGIVSLDKTVAHLGFHAHPTKTLTRTTTQKGTIWTSSTCLTHQTIVGRCKISDKTKTKAIFKPIQEDPNGQKHIKIETIRKTLDLIWLVSMKAQQLPAGLNKKFGFFQNLFLIWLGRTIGNRCDMENYFLLLRLTHQIFYLRG